MAFASLTMDLNARLANIESDLGKMSHLAEKHNQRMQAAFAKTGQVAATALSALGVGSLAAFVKSSIDAADNLNDLSKKTGVAVENLAGLQLVVDKSGTTMEMLGGGISKLNKTLGEAAAGSKSAQTILRDLGITATDPMEAFYQLADAFGRFKTEGDKANAMSQIIGKTWGELAPALAEGGDGLRAIVEEGKRLNPVTKEMAEQADKFNDAMSRFKAEAAGVGTSIANSILPAMNAMLERWNTALTLSRQHGGFIGLVLGGINPTADAGQNLNKVRDEIAAIQLQLKDAGTVQGDIAGINGPRLKARLAELEALKKTLLEIQRAEALALLPEHQRQTAPLAKGKISLTPDGAGKAAKAKENPLTTQSKADALRDYQLFDLPAFEAELAEFDAMVKRAVEDANDQFRMIDGPQFDAEGRAEERLKAMRDDLIDILDPIQKYREELDKIDELLEAGAITQDMAAAGRLYWQEQIDGAAGFGEQLRENESIAKDLGLTFSSAFEDAVVGGKKFSDVLKGLEQDIARIIIRKSVTEPLGNAISGIFSGINWGSIFGFGGGKATGGAVSAGTAYLVGEKGPELFVPNTSGGIVPNHALGGGNVQIVQHINVDSRSDMASIHQAMNIAKETAKAEILASMQRGGTYARAIGRA